MEKSNKGLYILLCVLIALLLILSGYIIYDKVLSKNDIDNPVENNEVDLGNRDIEIPNDIYGTYYNNVKYGNNYSGEYIILNSDGMAEVKHCSCGDTPLKPFTAKYKVSYIDNILMLLIDANGDNQYNEKYLILEENESYRFKPIIMGCCDEHDSYYVSKLD